MVVAVWPQLQLPMSRLQLNVPQLELPVGWQSQPTPWSLPEIIAR